MVGGGMRELVEAMTNYLGHVRTNLAAHLGRAQDRGYFSAKVFPVPTAVKDWFETFEGDLAWNNLAKTCARLFGKERRGEEERWKSRIRHWMRRKGTYLSLLDGVRPDPVEVAGALAKDITVTEDRIVLLAPLEGLGFAKTEMDFGDFQIFQPWADQLEVLLGTRANRIFYPYAAISTERLTDHWYLRCETKEERNLDRTNPPWFLDTFGGPVPAQYTHFSPRIEALLKSLILWDEQEYGLDLDYWMQFVSIPFVIEVTDNPFQGPRAAPPIGDFTSYQPMIFDGEEVGEEPLKIIDLDTKDTAKFEAFVREVTAQIQGIRSFGKAWEFVDLGLKYLLKGFFSDGLEQILWHIVSLEAFLGERGRGVTDRLLRRVGAISSEDPARSKEASETFKKLHDLRNDLVHGRVEVQAHSRDTWDARRLGRTVATRMITLLSRLAEEVRTGRLPYVPTREEVLGVLDLDVGSRGRQADLLRVFVNMSG